MNATTRLNHMFASYNCMLEGHGPELPRAFSCVLRGRGRWPAQGATPELAPLTGSGSLRGTPVPGTTANHTPTPPPIMSLAPFVAAVSSHASASPRTAKFAAASTCIVLAYGCYSSGIGSRLMNRAYHFFGATEGQMENAAICIQRHWRGHKV